MQKKIALLILWLGTAVLAITLYLQYQLGIDPCPLCMMQRLMLIVLLLSTLGYCFVTGLKTQRRFAYAQLFAAGSGLFFALRQIWLQQLPADQVPACVPGLSILLQYFPWQTVARALLWGSGDCAEQHWSWLGLSLPAWSGFYFLLMLLLIGFVVRRKTPS